MSKPTAQKADAEKAAFAFGQDSIATDLRAWADELEKNYSKAVAYSIRVNADRVEALEISSKEKLAAVRKKVEGRLTGLLIVEKHFRGEMLDTPDPVESVPWSSQSLYALIDENERFLKLIDEAERNETR